MGRGNVSGGFLDFFCRKKPAVGGRAVKGRGQGGGAGDRGAPGGREKGLLLAAGEGQGGSVGGWAAFVLSGWAGAGPGEGPECESPECAPPGNTRHLCAKMQRALAVSLFSMRALQR